MSDDSGAWWLEAEAIKASHDPMLPREDREYFARPRKWFLSGDPDAPDEPDEPEAADSSPEEELPLQDLSDD